MGTSDLSGWHTSACTDMQYMFEGASSFNSDLNTWDVSHVTNMRNMFNGASSFNGDVKSWDVSAVTSMRYMFRGAASFNSDVSSWDVSHVTDLSGMFLFASNFVGDLSGWQLSEGANTAGGPACPTCHADPMTMTGGAGRSAIAPLAAAHLRLSEITSAKPLDYQFPMACLFLLVSGFAVHVAMQRSTTTVGTETFYEDLAD